MTELQRDAFVEGLRGLLMRIFAIHVREYNNAEVAYQSMLSTDKRDRRAMVRTEVTRPGITSGEC